MVSEIEEYFVYSLHMLNDGQNARVRLHEYERIISVENLLAAWREFVCGKRKKSDVQEFQHRLMDNIFSLHRALKDGSYKHGGYYPFKISDPKPRDIHKATVRDRLVHHAVYRVLYPLFEKAVRLIAEIVGSFNAGIRGIGLPLGNLTSQVLVNVYMNRFDQYVKHRLKATYYIRYADDFTILSADRAELERLLPPIRTFLKDKLHLDLHPNKVSIQTYASGVDFLGWVHFPDHSVLRTTTKRRMLQSLKNEPSEPAKESYRGLLRSGNARKLLREI